MRGCEARDPSKLAQERAPSGLKVRFRSVVPRPPVSKADGSQKLDLQRDALHKSGIPADRIYGNRISGKREQCPGLDACPKAVRERAALVVWKLDRLGRGLRHLVPLVDDLRNREIALKVLTGPGACIDTTTAGGKLVFGIFAALAEFERELI